MSAPELKWMQRAIELARESEGLTRPNPPVGAVLVRDGQLVGEGRTQPAGQAHAEIEALGACEDPAGSTLYVTLEPCSTQGRTGACTDAIIAAKVARVVMLATDPNPDHAGAGVDVLRAAGIDVDCMDASSGPDYLPFIEAATHLIEPFAMRMLHQRPFVTLKLGMTLDGRIADADGVSQWITGAEAREDVQALRCRVDAVMVGTETVIADDPSLLPRPAKGREPFRVILDRKQRIPADRKVFCDEAKERTLRFGEVSLASVMQALAKRDIMHLLCEGGGQLATSLLQDGLVDELICYLAPGKILGGDGRPAFAAGGWSLADCPNFEAVRAPELLGKDLKLVMRPSHSGG